jgi:hypothetical protein
MEMNDDASRRFVGSAARAVSEEKVMTRSGSIELEEEINRLAAESLAVRMVLVHVLSRLSASANPEAVSAIRRGFAGAERALKERAANDSEALTPGSLAIALGERGAGLVPRRVKRPMARGRLLTGADHRPVAKRAMTTIMATCIVPCSATA